MDWKKSTFRLAGAIAALAIFFSVFTSAAVAGDSKRYIKLERGRPGVKLTRDEILSRVTKEYKGGRILSVQEKPLPSFPDCHIVRMLSAEGEYLAVHVACRK